MIHGTEPLSESASRGLRQPSSTADLVLECDRCGKALSREAAFEHAEHTDGEEEPVFTCRQCELGLD